MPCSTSVVLGEHGPTRRTGDLNPGIESFPGKTQESHASPEEKSLWHTTRGRLLLERSCCPGRPVAGRSGVSNGESMSTNDNDGREFLKVTLPAGFGRLFPELVEVAFETVANRRVLNREGNGIFAPENDDGFFLVEVDLHRTFNPLRLAASRRRRPHPSVHSSRAVLRPGYR